MTMPELSVTIVLCATGLLCAFGTSAYELGNESNSQETDTEVWQRKKRFGPTGYPNYPTRHGDRPKWPVGNGFGPTGYPNYPSRYGDRPKGPVGKGSPMDILLEILKDDSQVDCKKVLLTAKESLDKAEKDICGLYASAGDTSSMVISEDLKKKFSKLVTKCMAEESELMTEVQALFVKKCLNKKPTESSAQNGCAKRLSNSSAMLGVVLTMINLLTQLLMC